MTSPFDPNYKSQLGDFLKKTDQNVQRSKRATLAVSRLRKDDPDACKIPIHSKSKSRKQS